MDIKQLIHTLQHTHQLQPEQMQTLLTAAFSDAVIRAELAQAAQQTAQAVFGNKIYIRGLIEFTNYCRNDCYYCGIRRSNTEAVRYRLTEEKSFPAVSRVTPWALGPLFCRVAKILSTATQIWQLSSAP